MKGNIWVPLVREARSWWVFSKTRGAAKAKAKGKSGAKVRFDPDAMEVDKLKREQELEKKAPDRRESAMLSRHTTHRKVHEPPTGVSRALEVTPFKFLLKRMVKQDFLAGRKPLGESERALEDSPNSLVGRSACIGSNSLVGMSAACVGSNSLVGMSAACVGSNSLVGMSAACVGSDSLVGVSSSGGCGGADSSVGMSLSVRDQSFCDFGAGESNAPSSQRALNAQETRCTGGIIKAVGTMMRMLLIWLLVFSTLVGVGCEEIGPSPTASLLDKSYLAPSSSLPDSEYLAFSFCWHGFPRCVAKCILFRSWEYEVILGGTNRRNGEGCRSSLTILAPGASRAGWLCGFPSSFYNEPGWMEAQLNLPCVEGLEPEEVEVIPGPPISCTEYTPPPGAQENPQRVYVQDAETLTVDLIEAHSKRFSMASEGESWSLMGWSQDRFRALLADQTFDMSIDTINLAHVGLLLLLLLLLAHHSAPLRAHRAKPTLINQGVAKHSDCKLKSNMTRAGLQYMWDIVGAVKKVRDLRPKSSTGGMHGTGAERKDRQNERTRPGRKMELLEDFWKNCGNSDLDRCGGKRLKIIASALLPGPTAAPNTARVAGS